MWKGTPWSLQVYDLFMERRKTTAAGRSSYHLHSAAWPLCHLNNCFSLAQYPKPYSCLLPRDIPLQWMPLSFLSPCSSLLMGPTPSSSRPLGSYRNTRASPLPPATSPLPRFIVGGASRLLPICLEEGDMVLLHTRNKGVATLNPFQIRVFPRKFRTVGC